MIGYLACSVAIIPALRLGSHFRGIGKELREAHAWWGASHRADALLLSFMAYFDHYTAEKGAMIGDNC